MEPEKTRTITPGQKQAYQSTFSLIDLRFQRSVQRKKYLQRIKNCVAKINADEEKPKFVCTQEGCSKVYENRQQLAAHSRFHQPKKNKKISKNKKQ